MKNRILLFTILITSQIFAQETKYPQTDFVAPVNIPMYLSGTFGELRGNHFHSGIDIKTNGSEGIPIIAIADGYVSRIKVSPGGFGKALYIKHPNGYS
ncbi:MAG: M23 family metallopeptidase, partial [Bacteroidales bacterium]|nr:M23 family metallopeptidase [Bacteroidales bacterium]